MPVDMIIGTSALEKLEARVDMEHNHFRMTIERANVKLVFEFEKTLLIVSRTYDKTDGDDFKSM